MPHFAECYVGDGKYLGRKDAVATLRGDVDGDASHVGIAVIHVVEGMVSIDHRLRASTVKVSHFVSAQNPFCWMELHQASVLLCGLLSIN